ncbi:MAG: molybdate ABC transporter substrate-binding protein [Symploca sp. SIO2E6]|nr:molybdate ABC transporter substrate-binding protein [Symploca sp. SIO2E6]
MSRGKREFLGLLLSLLLLGCRTSTPNHQTPPSINLTVSVAASLQDAMKGIEPIYREQKPTVKITYNFGSSGSLQQQIEQGAPVDIFISAAPKQMNALQAKNLLLEGTRRDLWHNQVVLVVPQGAKGIADFQELTDDQVKKIAIGAPDSVPAGQYGKEVLTALNLYGFLSSKLVFAKDVRQVLTYVETGNVDAGIVYSTDAKISDKVQVVATAAAETHSPIIYPVAVLQESKNPDAAQDFIQFLSSDAATTVLQNYGFSGY